jgi:hypothetical protein
VTDIMGKRAEKSRENKPQLLAFPRNIFRKTENTARGLRSGQHTVKTEDGRRDVQF